MDPYWFQGAPTSSTLNNWSSCTYCRNIEHDSYSCPYLYENPPHHVYVHHDPYNHASFNALPSSYHDYREPHGAYSSWDLHNSSYHPSPHVQSLSPALSFKTFDFPEFLHGYG